MGALFSSRLKSLNFVSLRLNLEVFKVAQSKLSHILTRPIRTSVERMGLGQKCDSKHLNDCKRQGADQPSTRAGWSVPLLFTTECRELRVLKHFVDVHNYFVFVFCTFSSVCCICVCIVLSIPGG